MAFSNPVSQTLNVLAKAVKLEIFIKKAMPLENLEQLKKKNEARLRSAFFWTLSLGINLKTQSSSRDLMKLITLILLIGSCVDVYGHYSYIVRYRHNIVIIAESICTLLQTLLSIFKLAYVPFVQQQFYDMLQLVSNHKLVYRIELLSKRTPYNHSLRKEVQQTLDSCWKYALRQFEFYKYACLAIITYYGASSQVVNIYNWYIGNTNHTIVMPFPTLYPFWENDMHKLPQYLTLTFCGWCANFIAGVGAISFDGLFIAMHCVALIRILRKIIKFSTSPNVPKELHLNYLQQCIEHYERTFQFYKNFNELYLHMSLVQFLLSLITHGVVMFQGSVGLDNDLMMFIRMIMFMAASGYEVVIYCLNGQLITSESEYLPDSWFECEWYKESKEFKQLIKMMIVRSNRVFRMNASWFSTMSLETLLSMFQTSGSYFLLLRNLTV